MRLDFLKFHGNSTSIEAIPQVTQLLYCILIGTQFAVKMISVRKTSGAKMFHKISEVHLHRYFREYDFQKHSNRHLSDAERAEPLLKGAKGKRLLYHQPDETAQ